MSDLLTIGFIASLLFMSAAWLIYRLTNRPAIVDIAWSLSIILLAFLYIWFTGYVGARELLLLIMVSLSSGRLAYLLVDRMIKGMHDKRYDELSKSFGPTSYFFFFLAQGFASFILSIPFMFVAVSVASFGWVDCVAALLFIAAFYFEWKSDTLLHQFRQKPENRGEVCREGLWARTRHPNYFCEWLIWIAYALLALSAPYGYLAFISPLLMYISITKITGIPPTEKLLLKSKGEKYRDYQNSVPPFFPKL